MIVTFDIYAHGYTYTKPLHWVIVHFCFVLPEWLEGEIMKQEARRVVQQALLARLE